MSYKVKQNYKDLIDQPVNHKAFTRRDFLARGLATGVMSVAAHNALFGSLMSQAAAETMACPAPARNPGAVAQLFSNGGPTMGARFFSENQAAMMNANMAKNYGISGTNLRRLGPNMVIDTTSPFGFTLLQGPPGYAGGAAAWQANVLSKISGGAHLGPFNQDDGAGENTGLLGGVSPFKASQMGKDLQIGFGNTVAAWAKGMPAAKIGRNNLAPTSLANTFSLTPAANGLTNTAAMTAASDAANALGRAMASVFKTDERKGGQLLSTNAGCAFYGNSALADPNYGRTLFTPANIGALTSKLAVAQLSNAEQAQIAGFYQSAAGVAGGVVIQFNGRDYHGASAQNITNADVEEARAIVMFLAACDAAQAPGAMIYLSNGQAIANGTQQGNANINGATTAVNAPSAQGDAGGAYNAGLIIFYDPKGAPPVARFTGTVNQDGNAKTDPNVGSSQEAVAGLYLSALSWITGGKIPQAAIAKMQAAGVAGMPTKAMVI
jgi:hypothetical protein